jgi:hypothetical protein
MPLPLADRPRYLDRGIVNVLSCVRAKPDSRVLRAMRADVLAELIEIFRRHFIVLTLRRLSRS